MKQRSPSSARPFECRFAVGTATGPHSAIWKVWASRHTADVYAAARMMGGTMKLAIHQSGERHVGLTTEAVRAKQESVEPSVRGRHYDIWNSSYQAAPGVRLEYLFRFPTNQLRPFAQREKNSDKVQWLSPAPGDQALELGILIAEQEILINFASEYQVVKDGNLANGQKIALAFRYIPMGHFSNMGPVLDEISQDMGSIGLGSSQIHDGHRLVVGFNQEGRRGWAEFALDTFFPRLHPLNKHQAEPGDGARLVRRDSSSAGHPVLPKT